MSDLIAVTGNVTLPPSLHVTGTGVPMVTFGLASTDRRLENGQWQDGHTNFYNVSAFRALAENAFASLAKGQRVIVVGKLRVRRWEANGRSGTSIDLEAASLGPDLKFGVTTFRKGAPATASGEPARREAGAATEAGGEGGEAATGSSDAWAPLGSVDAATGEPVGPGAGPSSDAHLVPVGGWGADPASTEETPF